MSKFFDKVKGGANPAATPAGNSPFDLERELAAVTQRMDGQIAAVILDGTNAAQLDAEFGMENSVASEIAQFRLANCRKIELPKNSDKLVLSGSSPAIESYKSLRTRLTRAQANRGIHSIVVASAAQGDGKTLTSFNLAFCCSQLENMPVLLIDADLRTSGLTRLVGQLATAGLADVLSGTASYEDAIVSTNIPNLYLMCSGNNGAVSPAELFAKKTWKEFIGWSSEFFKLVLVDSLPLAPVADFELIAAGCEAVLFVVRARSTHRESLEKALAQIDPKHLIGVVLNDIKVSRRGNYYYYGNKSGK